MRQQVLQHIHAQETLEGAGVRVLRTIGLPRLDHLDPFLLLDEFVIPEPRSSPGIPWHPHRGFETVTYILEGEALHEDLAGGKGHLRTGDIQWMTAGSGIIHQEMPVKDGPPLRGLQLWVNLPAKNKMAPPRYQDLASDQIPEVRAPEGHVRVIAGSHADTRGVVDTYIPMTYLDVHVNAGGTMNLTLPQDTHAFAYMIDGKSIVGEEEVRAETSDLLVLQTEKELKLTSQDGARILVVAGKPLNEPIARFGPFVMNTRAELIQAFDDYQNGQLMKERD